MTSIIISIAGRVIHSCACPHENFETPGPGVQERSAVVLDEAQFYGIRLSEAPAEMEYTFSVGGIGIAEILGGRGASGIECGMRYGSDVFWMDHNYFESARGYTNLRLFCRRPGADTWSEVLLISVYVSPSKIGEMRYETMTEELRGLCADLVSDLFGKSRRSCSWLPGPAGLSNRSKEMELRAVEEAWLELQKILLKVARSPLQRLRREIKAGKYWGDRPVSPFTIRRLAMAGIMTRGIRCQRPLDVITCQLAETGDVAENRILLSFLILLEIRLAECIRSINRHIDEIRKEKPFRHVRFSDREKTLYEAFDQPKINRLIASRSKAERLFDEVRKSIRMPMFRGLRPRFQLPQRGCFDQNAAYRELKLLILNFIRSGAVWVSDGGGSQAVKLTSRIYENWVFMRVVDAFRKQGIEFTAWDEILNRSRDVLFTVDFYRGMGFASPLTEHKMLLIRYEPWIFPKEKAAMKNETVFRGGKVEVPWSPDILIECLVEENGIFETLYAIVIDCKYTMKVKAHHWDTVAKYLGIRSTATGRQVVKQLWLASPDETGRIICEDPAVRFTEDGPTCSPDEAIIGRIGAIPALKTSQEVGDSVSLGLDPFQIFARGTIRFLKNDL